VFVGIREPVPVVIRIEEVRRAVTVNVVGSLHVAAVVEDAVAGLVVGIVTIDIPVVRYPVTVGVAVSFNAVVDAVTVCIGVQGVNRVIVVSVRSVAGPFEAVRETVAIGVGIAPVGFAVVDDTVTVRVFVIIENPVVVAVGVLEVGRPIAVSVAVTFEAVWDAVVVAVSVEGVNRAVFVGVDCCS